MALLLEFTTRCRHVFSSNCLLMCHFLAMSSFRLKASEISRSTFVYKKRADHLICTIYDCHCLQRHFSVDQVTFQIQCNNGHYASHSHLLYYMPVLYPIGDPTLNTNKLESRAVLASPRKGKDEGGAIILPAHCYSQQRWLGISGSASALLRGCYHGCSGLGTSVLLGALPPKAASAQLSSSHPYFAAIN